MGEGMYLVESGNKIIPTAKGIDSRPLKKTPKTTETFSQALGWLMKNYGCRDAGLIVDDRLDWKEDVRAYCDSLSPSDGLTVAEGFFILTGIFVERAAYLFEFEGQIYFSMRPDFGTLSLTSDLEEKSLNKYERVIQDHLFEYEFEIGSICQAVGDRKILLDARTKRAPLSEWVSFFLESSLGGSHLQGIGSLTRGQYKKSVVAQYHKGGAPKSTITEVVEHVYQKLIQSGNTEIIKTGNLELFIRYLKQCITEGNTNASEYVLERIKAVRKTSGVYSITIHPRTNKELLEAAKSGKNISYAPGRVATILTNLRKEE